MKIKGLKFDKTNIELNLSQKKSGEKKQKLKCQLNNTSAISRPIKFGVEGEISVVTWKNYVKKALNIAGEVLPTRNYKEKNRGLSMSRINANLLLSFHGFPLVIYPCCCDPSK